MKTEDIIKKLGTRKKDSVNMTKKDLELLFIELQENYPNAVIKFIVFKNNAIVIRDSSYKTFINPTT